MDTFFVSVERKWNSKLKDKPVIIGGGNDHLRKNNVWKYQIYYHGYKVFRSHKAFLACTSIIFNPDIATAFFRAGLIEAWGRGP